MAVKEMLSNKLKTKILTDFEKRICANKSNNTGLLLIHSSKLGVHWKTAVHPNTTVLINPDQPYHIASIGKTMTSVIISILYEKGLLDFDDQIYNFLDDFTVTNLHFYKNIDYSKELKIKHLLNHSSGLPDYYTDRNKDRVRLFDFMTSEPGRFWTPAETIGWAKKQLKPKFQPGEGFHYSDTNYELLGLIIENVTGMKFHQALNHYVFEPLKMDHTYLLFYSEPKIQSGYPMVDLYHRGINLSKARSISMSCASGGIVSTLEDMLKFHQALVEHKLIREETFGRMCDFVKMGPSLYYGYGIMNFRFMFMPTKYHIWGNSGSIGAFMYYNQAMDVYMVGCFHKVNYQVQPILYIFNVMRKINKELKRKKRSANT